MFTFDIDLYYSYNLVKYFYANDFFLYSLVGSFGNLKEQYTYLLSLSLKGDIKIDPNCAFWLVLSLSLSFSCS